MGKDSVPRTPTTGSPVEVPGPERDPKKPKTDIEPKKRAQTAEPGKKSTGQRRR